MSLIPAATTVVNKWIWEFTGQAAHASVAAIAMASLHHHAPHGVIWALAVGVPAAAFKEFWWDYHYEDAATRGSSLLDFSMYMVGLAAGFFI